MNKYKEIFFTGALLVMSSNAFSDMYFGASLGKSSSSDLGSASNYSFYYYTSVESELSDTEDNAFSIFTGYDFKLAENEFAVEAGWVDLGESSLETIGQDFGVAGDGTRTLNVVAEAEAISISFIGKKSVAKGLSLFGRLGGSSWDVSGKVDGVVYNSSGSQVGSTAFNGSDSGTDIYFGLGLEYKFMRLQFDRYKIGESNTNFISIGAKI